MANKNFFKELFEIQDFIINTMIAQQDKYNNFEEVIKDTSYETIYRVLELLDGYGINNTQYEIKDLNTGELVNKEKSLHGIILISISLTYCNTFFTFCVVSVMLTLHG